MRGWFLNPQNEVEFFFVNYQIERMFFFDDRKALATPSQFISWVKIQIHVLSTSLIEFREK